LYVLLTQEHRCNEGTRVRKQVYIVSEGALSSLRLGKVVEVWKGAFFKKSEADHKTSQHYDLLFKMKGPNDKSGTPGWRLASRTPQPPLRDGDLINKKSYNALVKGATGAAAVEENEEEGAELF